MAGFRVELRVLGPVPPDAVQELGDLTVTTSAPSTVLTGVVADQAELLGLLARLHTLGLRVAELHRVPTTADDLPRQRPEALTDVSSVTDDAAAPTGPAPWTRSQERGGSMTDEPIADELQTSGPIDYIVVEFPGNRMTGEAFPLLVDLVDRGLIRIIDLMFIRKEADGSVTALDISDVDQDGSLDLAVFQGAASGLLASDDLEEAATALEPNSSAGVLIYENVWAAPFATALRRAGGQLVASGRIPVQALLAALDATEPVS
jgi:hypothetical protein